MPARFFCVGGRSIVGCHRGGFSILDAGGRPANGGSILFVSTAENLRSNGRVDSNGAFRASVRAAGEYRADVIAGQGGSRLMPRSDFLAAHRGGFPPVQIVEGANAPLVLRTPQLS